MLAITVLLSGLWEAAVRDRHLLRPDVSGDEVRAITLATAPNMASYVGATLLAIVAPKAAALVYQLIAIASVLRARGDEVPLVARG